MPIKCTNYAMGNYVNYEKSGMYIRQFDCTLWKFYQDLKIMLLHGENSSQSFSIILHKYLCLYITCSASCTVAFSCRNTRLARLPKKFISPEHSIICISLSFSVLVSWMKKKIVKYNVFLSVSIIQIWLLHLHLRSQDSCWYSNGLWAGQGSIPRRDTRFSSIPHHPEWLWGPPSLVPNGYWGSFPRDKAAGAWSWPHMSIWCRSQEWKNYTIHSPKHLHGMLFN
jgi:hypothetical protein